MDTKKRLSSSVRPRVQTINENNPSVGACIIARCANALGRRGRCTKKAAHPKLASVFKRIKPRLYFFTSDAILLIPCNRVRIKCARHPLER